MASYELSEYQKNIMNYVSNQRGNLLVDAKAGSGKTTTLVMIANALTQANKKCLFLAFNKHIVEELSTKINDGNNCMIKTVHSLGYSFVLSYLYKKHGKDNYSVEVNTSKLRELVKEYYDKNFKARLDFYNTTGATSPDDFTTSSMADKAPNLSEEAMKELHSDIIGDFVNLCNFSRFYNINYKQDNKGLYELADRFCWHLMSYIDDVFTDFQDLVIAVIDKIKELFENPDTDGYGKPHYVIDYTDMIYFPVLYNMGVPYSVRQFCDIVMVDESQDLSKLQQLFIKKLNTNFNRFIFVGDKKQAIYSFAGADCKSIDNLDRVFALQHLPLNICYRCPEKVIKLAQEIVPEIEWNTMREDKGEVKFLTIDEMYAQIQPDDVLVGRKNKDLLKIYRKFTLNLKKPVKFRNKELINSLCSNIDLCISEYIKLYNKGVNIQVPLDKHMAEWMAETSVDKDTDLYNTEMQQYAKKLISDNSGKSARKNMSNASIDFLLIAMNEYKELGNYGRVADDNLTEFHDILTDFLGDYKAKNASILIDDFKIWLKSFLSGSIYDRAPIISSVHSMKGGEADNVYIYDYPMFPYKMGSQSEDDKQQEKNLKYVAITRAKKNLYLILCDESDDNDKAIELNNDCVATVKHLLGEDDK